MTEQLMARAAAALSMEPDEIIAAVETPDGLVAVTKDDNALVINEDHDPAVQFLVPPKAGYAGSFPVLHAGEVPLAPPADDPDQVLLGEALNDIATRNAPKAPDGDQDNEPAAPPADPGAPPPADPPADGLPDGFPIGGSVAEVLDAVGDDSALAAAVLAHEQSADKPRKTLVSQLEELTGENSED